MSLPKKTIVLANGVFDVFHYGHLRHLRAAKALGDFLVVSVTNDEFVDKGPGRPMFPIIERMAIIYELRCVDSVIRVDNSLEALEIVKPSIFAKGKDYKGKIRPEDSKFCAEHGIRIAFTNEPTYSSTEIINAGFGQG